MSSSMKDDSIKVCCTSGKPGIGLSTYRPRGEEILIGEIKAYRVSPCTGAKGCPGVVLLYDIFGLDIINTRRFADLLSEKACLNVVIPDIFKGKPWSLDEFPPKDFNLLIKWLEKAGRWKVVLKMLARAYKVLVKIGCNTRVGVLGFCWGGKQVLFACTRERTKELGIEFKCGVSIHGAWLGPEDALDVSVPIMLLPSGEDPDIKPLVEIFSKKDFGDKCRYFRFEGEIHGFAAARGDLTSRKTFQAVTMAIELAANFFTENL